MPQEQSVSLPGTVAWLGYGGLLPFLLLATVSMLDPAHGTFWRDALCAYGAVILSFVGALHWGLAMSLPNMTEQQRSRSFIWSVLPALLAWLALLVSSRLAAPILVFGFVAHFLMDQRLKSRAALPGWYIPLRLKLTSIASLSLLSTTLIHHLE